MLKLKLLIPLILLMILNGCITKEVIIIKDKVSPYSLEALDARYQRRGY